MSENEAPSIVKAEDSNTIRLIEGRLHDAGGQRAHGTVLVFRPCPSVWVPDGSNRQLADLRHSVYAEAMKAISPVLEVQNPMDDEHPAGVYLAHRFKSGVVQLTYGGDDVTDRLSKELKDLSLGAFREAMKAELPPPPVEPFTPGQIAAVLDMDASGRVLYAQTAVVEKLIALTGELPTGVTVLGLLYAAARIDAVTKGRQGRKAFTALAKDIRMKEQRAVEQHQLAAHETLN